MLTLLVGLARWGVRAQVGYREDNSVMGLTKPGVKRFIFTLHFGKVNSTARRENSGLLSPNTI